MQMNFGNMQFRADERGVAISHVDQPENAFRVESDCIGEFIDFLSSLSFDQSYRRRAFRVPVFEVGDLVVILHLEHQDVKVKARDLSVIGIFVEIPNDADFDLQAGKSLEITIQLDDLSATCKSVICRRVTDGCGLSFPDSIVDGEFCPPPVLEKIVMDLQGRWIRHRHKKLREFNER